MIRQFVFALILLLAAAPAVAQKQDGPPPQVSAGSIVDLGVVQSKYADPRRCGDASIHATRPPGCRSLGVTFVQVLPLSLVR